MAMHQLTLLPAELLQLDRDEDDRFRPSIGIWPSSLESTSSSLLLALVVLIIFEIFEDRVFFLIVILDLLLFDKGIRHRE